MSEAIIHFEHALQLVQGKTLPKMPAKADLQYLYTQLGQTYEMVGQTENALAMNAERDKLG